jgi:hypothetical protein
MQTVRNYSINQSSLQELSNGVNNPFDQLAKMFEQTPLVRINTVDVPVNIPMIYAEDIAKYESYLKTRTERNKQILRDWETILQGTLGICGKNYDLLSNSKNNISQPPVISKEFFKQLYKKLKDEKEQLKEKTQKKKELYKEFKSCKAEKRNKDDPSCMKIMNTFSINEK